MTTFIGKSDPGRQAAPSGRAGPRFYHPSDGFDQEVLVWLTGRKVISVIPSIDTGICSTQTRRFNQELAEMDQTVVITVSCDPIGLL